MNNKSKQLGLSVHARLLYPAQLILLFALYVIAARLGLSLYPVSEFATLIWPPTGIAIACLWLWGNRLWPAIFIGALTANLLQNAAWPVAAAIAAGNTLEAVVAVLILRRFAFDPVLQQVKDVLILTEVAALGAAISATVGISSLAIGGMLAPPAYASTWSAWWTGDLLGALTIAPVILIWSRWRKELNMPRSLWEKGSFALLLLATGLWVFQRDATQVILGAYLLFPPLTWIAMRATTRVTVTIVFLTKIAALIGTIAQRGPFAASNPETSLQALQLFMGVMAFTIFLLAATTTERRRALTNVQLANQSLEKKVRERTAALLIEKEQQLRQKTEQESRAREFVSMTSHQLLTPLALIKGYISLLLSGKTASSEKKQYLEETMQGAERMDRFIQNLLTIARIESGSLKLATQVFDISPIITETCDAFRPAAAAKNIEIRCNAPTPITVTAHPDHVREVLSNLLSNAVKFTPAGSITVTAQAHAKTASVTVSDTGIGIRPQDIPRIFTKFYMSENWVEKQAESNGLGLYISKLLAESMSSTITVTSKQGEGSTFTVTLPLSASHAKNSAH